MLCLILRSSSAQLKVANRRSLKAFVLVAISLLLVGCGDPDRGRISGSWKVATAEKLMNQVNAVDDLPAADTENLPPRMQVHFNYSGSLMTETNLGSVATKKYGSWKFLNYDAASKTARIECFMLDETTEFDVLVDDENTIRLVPPNMAGLKQKMKFVRQ
jgi:hypothetical protein